MNLRVLENLKYLNLEENELLSTVNSSYEFYINNSQSQIDENIIKNVKLQKAFSCLIRFFRSINSNKKIEEDVFLFSLKEVLKDKTKSISSITQKVKEIISIQTTRISFTDKLSKRNLNYLSNIKYDNSIAGDYNLFTHIYRVVSS